MSPYEITLKPDETIDFGWIVVFLSTEPANLKVIAQRSPFEPGYRGGDLEQSHDELGKWELRIIPVIQRKA